MPTQRKKKAATGKASAITEAVARIKEEKHDEAVEAIAELLRSYADAKAVVRGLETEIKIISENHGVKFDPKTLEDL